MCTQNRTGRAVTAISASSAASRAAVELVAAVNTACNVFFGDTETRASSPRSEFWDTPASEPLSRFFIAPCRCMLETGRQRARSGAVRARCQVVASVCCTRGSAPTNHKELGRVRKSLSSTSGTASSTASIAWSTPGGRTGHFAPEGSVGGSWAATSSHWTRVSLARKIIPPPPGHRPQRPSTSDALRVFARHRAAPPAGRSVAPPGCALETLMVVPRHRFGMSRQRERNA